MSLPARVAWVTAVFLVIVVTVVLIGFLFFTENHAAAWTKLNWKFITGIAILLVLIPFVLYKALKLWLEGGVSPFPDIDHAWEAGLAELERQGLEITQIPLFLMLGTSGENQERILINSARLECSVREVPKGPTALHWYANPDGIYLVCSNVSCLSRLSRHGRETLEEEAARPGPIAPLPSPESIRGTIVAGGTGAPYSSSAPAPSAPAPARDGGAANIRGTMVAGISSALTGELSDGDVSMAAEKKVVKLTPAENLEQERRLEYVCRLLRRARLPLSPINGVLVILPFNLLQRSVPESHEVQRAVKRDVAVLLRVLSIRCPVTALVAGMEEHNGFQELVRRVGRDRAGGQRFGKGFNLSNFPLAERLEALAIHACGAFEDWVYALFREKGALSHPGNTRLYALLCKIRRDVQSRLANVLAAGLGHDPDQDPQSKPLFFGGCYFAATGNTEDQQAFIKGVFDKLPEQQEDLQWADQAIQEDRKHQFLANCCLAFDTLLLIGLAGLIYLLFRH